MHKMSENVKRKRFVEAGKLNQFDTKTQKLLEEIDKAQNALEEIQQKTLDEIVALEQRNSELRKPWHERRAAYIAQIPNFWVTTMLNHPDINMLMDEEEENCMHHLKKFEVEEFADVTAGYYLKFGFESNPYFENELLVKEYHLNGEPKCVSTNILWKEGIQPMGQPQENFGASPGRKRRMESKSFFKWFRDNTDPVSDDIAEIFKDDIWNNPLQYYLVPDIESNEAGSSPSDSSDTEEPKRREKTERPVVKPAQNNRSKTNSNTISTPVSDISTSSNNAAPAVPNENRSAELSTGCVGESSDTGHVGDGETGSNAGGPSGSSNHSSSRRRMYISGEYAGF